MTRIVRMRPETRRVWLILGWLGTWWVLAVWLTVTIVIGPDQREHGVEPAPIPPAPSPKPPGQPIPPAPDPAPQPQPIPPAPPR